jgi:hypothetical protein
VCYGSDKWTGKYVEYKHDHEKPFPKYYVPNKNGDHRLPSRLHTFAGLAILGNCLELAVLNEAGGEMVEIFAKPYPVLCTVAAGNALVVLNNKRNRVIAVCYGGKLEVETRGIVG